MSTTCQKNLSIKINSVFSCPGNQSVELTASSPTSLVRAIQESNSPYYCQRISHAFGKDDNVICDFGDDGLTGALDTYLYCLVNGQATGAGTNNTIVVGGKTWTTDCFATMDIYITDGTGSGYAGSVFSNTGNVLTIDPPLGVATDSTTKFSIVIDEDDDGGAGANSQLDITAPTSETYTFEGTTFSRNVIGKVEMKFTCPLVADFDWTPHCGGTVGVTNFAFTDQTTGHPTSWEWDFGDGSAHAVTQNTSHQYAATDLTAYPSMCGSRTVILTVHRGVLTATKTDTLEVKRKIQIKNYVAGYFTLGAQAVACSNTAIAAWDGTFPPWTSCSPCAWLARNVNIEGKLLDIAVVRADSACCMPGQPVPPFGPLGFIIYFGCGGSLFNYCDGQYDYSTSPIGSNNPSGIYTLRTNLNKGACGFADYVNNPLTVEIEYVP